MTSKFDDAALNYLQDGPDLRGRVAEAVERSMEDSPFSYGSQKYADAKQKAMEVARSQLIGDTAQVHPLVVRPEKILDVNTGGKPVRSPFGPPRFEKPPQGKDTFFDYDNGYNPDTGEFGNESGSGLDFLGALDRRLRETEAGHNDIDHTVGDIGQAMSENEGLPASSIERMVRNTERLYDAYTPDGPFVGPGELLQQVYRDLGYDAIRHSNADQTFPGLPMPAGTSHLTMFDPEKVRRIDAAFDPNRKHESGLYYANGDDKVAPFAVAGGDDAHIAMARGFWKRPEVQNLVFKMNAAGKSPAEIRAEVGNRWFDGKTPSPDAFYAAVQNYYRADPKWQRMNEAFTPEKKQQLVDMAQTMSVKDIADATGHTPYTIQNYLKQIAKERGAGPFRTTARKAASEMRSAEAASAADEKAARQRADETKTVERYLRSDQSPDTRKALGVGRRMLKRYFDANPDTPRRTSVRVSDDVRATVFDLLHTGKSYDEIAAQTGKTRGAIAGIISRGRSQ